MKKNTFLYCLFLALTFFSCTQKDFSKKEYNQGINIIPKPQELTLEKGQFHLNEKTRIVSLPTATSSIAEFLRKKLAQSTGFPCTIVDSQTTNSIFLKLSERLTENPEGYTLHVKKNNITITSTTSQGLFYGIQSLLQLLPAEIESSTIYPQTQWNIPTCSIKDYPRFNYRGLMIDVARHFTSISELKKQIDVLAMFKINRLHLHLSDYQGWRIEIKKYPRLTSVGGKRIDEYGKEYSGYYTQEEMRDLIKYAADRFITIIPEIDIPGHSLAAIAAYPKLSCTGDNYPVMNRWGGFPVVLCPGKEVMFEMLDGIFKELSELFPSQYFHIGGDECPKKIWKSCKQCQARIRTENLKGDKNHSAEEKLQSYAIGRCEKILKKYGKKIIGWDEILEGGLAPDATVMSWRGEKGGIKSALMKHQVIMTPTSGGMYLDHYQGDAQVEPFAWGAYAPIRKTYAYDPIPDTLVTMGKEKYILGVQANAWSECMYTSAILEYRIFPRILAVAEVGWTNLKNKNFDDFSRRLNNAAVRMDMHHINYHIPLPEQPGGSINHIVFTDSIRVPFSSTRPIQMIYTLDGSEPTRNAKVYTQPLLFTQSDTLKIRSILPSGKMSKVRTIPVIKQKLKKALNNSPKHQGLKVKITDTRHLYVKELSRIKTWRDSTLSAIEPIAKLRPNPFMNVEFYAAIAEGYVYIDSPGVYYFRSDNTRVSIGNKIVVNNDNRPQVNSKYGYSMALEKGWHAIKIEQISNSIGGWNSQHRNRGSVWMKKKGEKKFTKIEPKNLGY